MTSLRFLDVDDVLHIHNRVCADFAASTDPVDTPGPRDVGLLESAVARQQTGAGDYLKYDSVCSSAATLTFGLCCNHPFHNGNKRTALVAMIAHLERNEHALFDTRHDELYAMIKDVAKHSLAENSRSRSIKRAAEQFDRQADREVAAIGGWLRKRARHIVKSERRITHHQLRKILNQYSLDMRDPKSNSISICRKVVKRRVFKTTTEWERVCVIKYRGETQPVGLNDIKRLRHECGLTAANGYDSEVFYRSDDPVDLWINDYRSVLERLSKE